VFLFKVEVEFHQTEQPALVRDLQGYVTILTSHLSYGLIFNQNRIAYVYIMGMQSKYKCIYNCVISHTYSTFMVTLFVLRSKNLAVLSMEVVIILSSWGANMQLVMVLVCNSVKNTNNTFNVKHTTL